MKLCVATCQFPIGRDVRKNRDWIFRQMRRAKGRGAQVAHFPETALSGYAGSSFKTFKGYDWDLLKTCTLEIMALARELKLWVILGSSHRLTGRHAPHNSLYIINDRGQLVDRYDKLFCTGGDLKHYSPGSRFVTVAIKGVRCGFLICYDVRFPELYRQYLARGAQVMFHSFHNAALKRSAFLKYNIWGAIMPPTLQAHAACNHMWLSANNSCRAEGCWGSRFIRPDGVVLGELPRNDAGILLFTADTRLKLYDAPRPWRKRAMAGIFHSGTLVRDKRSEDRRTL